MIHHESVGAKLGSDSRGVGCFDVIEMGGEFLVIESDGGATLHRLSDLEDAIAVAQQEADKFDRAKIEDLKSQWRADPVWDIETTEGYEDFRNELYIFRLETERADLKQELSRIRSIFQPVAKYFAEITAG